MILNRHLLFLALSLLFVGFDALAQSEISPDPLVNFIIREQADSALIQLEGENTSSNNQLDIIKRIAKQRNVTYKDYQTFIEVAMKMKDPDYSGIVRFIDNEIPIPNSDRVNMAYVEIKRSQISIIRNELLDLTQAGIKNRELQDYINKYPDDSPAKVRANIITSIHDIVMKGIQQEIELGLEMTMEMEKKARSINDTALIIGSYYYRNDFLYYQGKLDEYLEHCRKSYELDRLLSEHSEYYLFNIETWLSALIYQGDNRDQILELLEEHYSNSENQGESLTLYAQFLINEPPNSPATKNIFKKFNVTDPIALSSQFEAFCKTRLNTISYQKLVHRLAKYLHAKGYYDESREYYEESISQIKNVYSKDLSKTIADYEADLIERTKQAELDEVSSKKRLFVIIAVLAGFLLALALFSLYRQILTSRRLKLKNKEIILQRDMISRKEKEKELLLNELHHRVKNNFQVIINLLILQSASIKDTKTQALINESINRVKSMAFVHGKLVTSDTLQVDFEVYIKDLVSEIKNSFQNSEEVDIDIRAEGFQFNVDTSVPLGLIVNELTTNAFKYGFGSDTKKLVVEIKRSLGDYYELTIFDNGPGLSPEFDLKNASSLGLKLVYELAKQLGGELKLRQDGKSEFVILFQELQY
ncbi:MAG: sensor histidine kinase [Cyclobacteriaceae bacterium]